MPFLRFSRDKRGYEYVYLVQPVGKRGKVKPRILYWYRTPPGVRVGRDPFDDEVRRSIEARYPDVEFDWPKLLATPKPPPQTDVERWRERRRQAKAERAAAAADNVEADEIPEPAEPEIVESGEAEPLAAAAEELLEEASEAVTQIEAAAASVTTTEPAAETQPQPERKRRRRRRRRRKPSGPGEITAVEGGAAPAELPQRRDDDASDDEDQASDE